MRVVIRKRNLEITPALSLYIEKKIIRPIQKLIGTIRVPELPILDLEIGRSTRHHRKGQVYRAGATLKLNGKVLRADAEESDARAACDVLEGELRRGITAYKDKLQTVYKRGARRLKKDLRLHRAARLYRKGRIRDEGI